MKIVVLSTTEAEYVAVSEVVKEITFLYQMLRSMEIKDNYLSKFKLIMLVQFGWQIIAMCQRGKSMLFYGHIL